MVQSHPMAQMSRTSLDLPQPLVRRVRRMAREVSQPVSDFLKRALETYQQQQEEQKFLRAFRAAARRRGIRSQRDVARVVDDARAGR